MCEREESRENTQVQSKYGIKKAQSPFLPSAPGHAHPLKAMRCRFLTRGRNGKTESQVNLFQFS